MSKIEQHHYKQKHDHDGTSVDQHLHDPDELGVEHYVKGGEAEHRVHEPERGRNGALPRNEHDRGCESDYPEEIEVKNVEQRIVLIHHSPFGSSGSHISQTGWVWSIRRCRS